MKVYKLRDLADKIKKEYCESERRRMDEEMIKILAGAGGSGMTQSKGKKVLCASCGEVKVSIYKGICDKCKRELTAKHLDKPRERK